MVNAKDKVPLILFIGAIVAFTLPFISLSFFGYGFEATGIELVKGVNFMGDKAPKDVLLGGVLIVSLCGLLLSLWRFKTRIIIQMIMALLGVIGLIADRIVANSMIDDPEVMLAFNWEFGYYISILSLIGAVFYSIYLMVDGNTGAVAPVGLSSMDSICPHCHRGNEAGSAWCRWCGGSMYASVPVGPVCPHCHNANEPNSTWCQWCGGKMGEQVQPAANICPHCAKENGPGNVFCYWCGGSLSVSADSPPAQPSLHQGAADFGFSSTVPLMNQVKTETDAGPIPFLRVQRVGRWELIPMLKDEFIVGADPVCSDYIEHSGNLGQLHAMIAKENDTFSITKSNEGVVQVNDQPLQITQKYPLKPGDIVSMGDVVYIFDLA